MVCRSPSRPDADGVVRGVGYAPIGGVMIALREHPGAAAATKKFGFLNISVPQEDDLAACADHLDRLAIPYTPGHQRRHRTADRVPRPRPPQAVVLRQLRHRGPLRRAAPRSGRSRRAAVTMSVAVRVIGSGGGTRHVVHLPRPASRRPATPLVMALALASAVALAALPALGTLTWPAYGSGRPIPSPRPLSSVG